MANILIIDDDEMICEILSHRVINLGHTAAAALTLKDGFEKASSEDFDVVFLDVRLPDGNGLNLLPKIRKIPSLPEVIIITGVGDPDGAELAVRSGAWDYIQKPFSKQEIILQLDRALDYREKRIQKAPVVLKRSGIIGSSPQMNAHLDLLAQTIYTNANVLITGESGTGKELFAKAIHENSPRASKNFVVVDCTVLPENLVESVLFGHKKGAFTGADRTEEGLIKHADGGTLFLDEVGELPLAVQKKFLRAIQEHCFRPVGSNQEVSSDFRLIAATNRELKNMAQAGQFRQDLLFRLQAFIIELSPLRERISDIRELTLYYIAKICDHNRMETKGFSSEFIEALEVYDWPGNVRELVNILERVIAAELDTPALYPQHLPDHIRINIARAKVSKQPFSESEQKISLNSSKPLPPLKDARDAAITKLERQYLHDLMLLTKGNIKEACKVSGLSRARLYELLKKYNISRNM
jgi:two-component system NtrC family response regulator